MRYQESGLLKPNNNKGTSKYEMVIRSYEDQHASEEIKLSHSSDPYK